MNRIREAMAASAVDEALVSGDGIRQNFRFDESFPGFSGHFPGYPILPAILQTLLMQLLAEQWAGTKLRMVALTNAKFTRQLRPGEDVAVEVTCERKVDGYYCRGVLSSSGESAAQLQLIFEDDRNR